MRLLIHDYAGHAFPLQLSRQLAEDGHTVYHAYATELVTPRGRLERLSSDSLRFHIVGIAMSSAYRADKYSFIKRWRHERDYGRALANEAERLDPDFVLSANTPSGPQWSLMRWARKRKRPVFIWVQDFYSLAVGRLARKRLPIMGVVAGWWYLWLDFRCLSAAAGVVAITSDFVPILKRFRVREDRIKVIPNWAPLEEIPRLSRDNAWSRRHQLTGQLVFLYAGTLAMKHNPDLLVSLARELRRFQGVMIVVSEGPGADYLTRRRSGEALDNLRIFPFQRFEDLPEVLASADVLVAILEKDAATFSVPSKVLAYHAAGRPILAAIPGVNLAARTISRARSGLCVEPDNPEEFCRNAGLLASDPALRAATGDRARAFAEQEFDIKRITRSFQELIAKAGTGRAERRL